MKRRTTPTAGGMTVGIDSRGNFASERSSSGPLRETADDIAALFDAPSVDLEALTPFEAQVLMLWNRLELRLEGAGGAQ